MALRLWGKEFDYGNADVSLGRPVKPSGGVPGIAVNLNGGIEAYACEINRSRVKLSLLETLRLQLLVGDETVRCH